LFRPAVERRCSPASARRASRAPPASPQRPTRGAPGPPRASPGSRPCPAPRPDHGHPGRNRRHSRHQRWWGDLDAAVSGGAHPPAQITLDFAKIRLGP